MTDLAVTGMPATEGGARRLLPLLWPILAALMLLRLALATWCNLLPDEAFYWLWTRHLAPGYLDHPPMIACLMWLSTRLLGDTQIGMRLPSVLMSLASIAMIVWLARRLLKDTRAAGYVAMMWLTSPLIAVLGLVFTPDTPAVFFSTCALAFAAVLTEQLEIKGTYPFISSRTTEPQEIKGTHPFKKGVRPLYLWMGFGASCGLAMVSKYTTVLVPAGVTLALLTSRRGRREFSRPGIYLAGMLALLIFSPVVYWNATHHWASFLFQLHHGAGESLTQGAKNGLQRLLLRLGGLGEFLGGQALVWTPVLFVLTLVVLVVNWRKYLRLREVDRLLLWCGTLPLILFGWAATRSHGEMNWPAFAYFPLSILVARYLTENWSGIRVHWVREGCKLALIFSAALHLLAVPGVIATFGRLRIPLPHNVTDLYGWREFGRQLSQRAQGLPVICNRHQDAGEAEFYMLGQPPVWCDSIGSRPTAFDYFDTGRPDYAKLPRVIFVGSHEKEFAKKYGYLAPKSLGSVELPGPGKHRSRPVWLMSRE